MYRALLAFCALRNFCPFSCDFPAFGGGEADWTQKTAPPAKGSSLDRQRRVVQYSFSFTGSRCTQPARALPAPGKPDSFCTRAGIPHAP